MIEIENDGYGPDSAIQFLVDRLNEATSPDMYAFIDADAETELDAMGSDAIKVALSTSPGAVPIGLDRRAEHRRVRQRWRLGPAKPAGAGTGVRGFGHRSAVGRDVNHFKSKGSACDAPDAGDGQGNCNPCGRRCRGADCLAGDRPDRQRRSGRAIVGDLNAYSMEQPVTTLRPPVTKSPAGIRRRTLVRLRRPVGISRPRPCQFVASTANRGCLGLVHQRGRARRARLQHELQEPGQVAGLYASDWFRMSDHNPLLIDLALDVDFDDRKDHRRGRAASHESLWQCPRRGRFAADLLIEREVQEGQPDGQITLVVHGRDPSGARRYQIASTDLTAILREATGEGTILANAIITDVTNASAPLVIDRGVAVRITVDDNGEPGRSIDTLAVTVGRATHPCGWRRIGTAGSPQTRSSRRATCRSTDHQRPRAILNREHGLAVYR